MAVNPPNALENLGSLRYLKERPAKTGIFLDLDGTLCPIIDDPDEVRLSPTTRRYLEGLSTHYRAVVIISGRAASALVRIVDLPSIMYVGNHGLEMISEGQRRVLLPRAIADRMRTMGEELDERVKCEGALLELKELSHAIHYRRATDHAEARDCILDSLAKMDLSGARITEGKMLVQLRPDYPLDKGQALETIVAEEGIRQVLYAGDDTTDMDAFRSIEAARRKGVIAGHIICVRHFDTPAELLRTADLIVEGTEGMQQLLGWLLSNG